MATHDPTIATPLALGPDDHGRKVSAEEFASAEFLEPWKYEREKGRLVVMAPDGSDHVRTSNPWRDRLVYYHMTHPGVIEEVVTGAWVRVDGGTDRIGDIGVYLVQDPPIFKLPDQVPELMYEIVSPGKESINRDYVKKRAEYSALGVREYVIVDRRVGKVTVLTQTPDGDQERTLTRTDTYTTALLPGLSIALAEVLPKRK